jgi:hypothetical protein
MCVAPPSEAVHTVGTHVWVQDENTSWVKGTVVRLDGSSVTVTAENGAEYTCTAAQAPLQNEGQEAVEVSSSSSWACACML